jgi:Zn-dependent protease with chaperone function
MSAVSNYPQPRRTDPRRQKLQANDKPFAKFNHATAAMCIDDPLQHHQSWVHHLFDTHPPISERIAVLEHIEYGIELPDARRPRALKLA